MGRIRTKSKFYTHNQNTIGDIAEIGNNQIDIHNISLNQVNNTISIFPSQSPTIQGVVNSNNVNKWAAFRPYPSNYEGVYGWDFTSSGLIMKNGNDDNQKRLGDFAGYNHQALPSRLLHDPGAGVIGEDFTTTNRNLFGANITVRFKLEEVSPFDIYPGAHNLRMYVVNGTSMLGQQLATIDIANYDTFTNTLTVSVPKGFTLYGSRTFSVWFGDKYLSTPQYAWKFANEVINTFTLTVKTYFNYVFSTQNMGSNYFNISVENENNSFGQRPETSITTLRFHTNLMMGFGDSLRIDVSQNGWDWTHYQTISPTVVPTTYNIDWFLAFGSGAYTAENSIYYVRVTYITLFGF